MSQMVDATNQVLPFFTRNRFSLAIRVEPITCVGPLACITRAVSYR